MSIHWLSISLFEVVKVCWNRSQPSLDKWKAKTPLLYSSVIVCQYWSNNCWSNTKEFFFSWCLIIRLNLLGRSTLLFLFSCHNCQQKPPKETLSFVRTVFHLISAQFTELQRTSWLRWRTTGPHRAPLGSEATTQGVTLGLWEPQRWIGEAKLWIPNQENKLCEWERNCYGKNLEYTLY